MNDPIALLTGTAWAMEESALRRLVAQVRLSADVSVKLEAAAGQRPAGSARRDSVAVIPLYGVLRNRPGPWDWLFGGGWSVLEFVDALRSAAVDREVQTIVVDVDSPGGSVEGIPEAAAVIREVASRKPVVAVATGVAASAAYWLASQATTVYASPSALVGSIGVYTLHMSDARWLDKHGFDPTYVYAGKYKVEGNSESPLTAEARAHFQSLVDDAYFQFIGDVAKGRHTTRTAVRTGYGEGRVLPATEAVREGLVDRIRTLDQVVASTLRESRRFQAERRDRAFRAERDRRVISAHR